MHLLARLGNLVCVIYMDSRNEKYDRTSGILDLLTLGVPFFFFYKTMWHFS